MRRFSAFVVSGLLFSALGANCVGPVNPGGNKPPRDDAALRSFGSAEELREFLASQAREQYKPAQTNWTPFGWLALGGAATPMAAPSMAEASADAGGNGDNRGYSTTNIQEAGVDESDVVKNDHNLIFMLSGDKIHVVKANPAAELQELATVLIPQGGDSLYLRGNTLVALSTSGWLYGYGGWAEPMPAVAAQSVRADMIGGPWSDGVQTTVTILDVSDPVNPVLKGTLKFEGSLISSRLIESKLHLVLQTMPKLPDNPTPASINAMTLDDWLPDAEVVAGGTTVFSGNVAGWDRFLGPVDPDGYAMTVVTTLDVDNPAAPFESTAVAANVGTVYASTQSLYLTDSQYAYNSTSSRVDTAVHKLSFNNSGTLYVASGLIPGRPLNQYSLGEHEGYLRIATTNEVYRGFDEELSSGVYVLGVDGADLKTVGKIEGIAAGEKIYAARFVGPRGFLVTFRRVDPLFAMDLSNPTDPKIVGELKVPGFSDHIQIMDENHLLAIGRSTEDAGDFAWIKGVQLTIFDVTDMSHPKVHQINGQDAKVEIGTRGTYSEANSNPKAFNYFAAKNALAFPINLYEGGTTAGQYGQHSFTGLYVYRVTVADGFQSLGRIASAPGPTAGSCFMGYYGTTRGVFIDDSVYSVTDRGVKIAALAEVNTIVKQIDFAGISPLVTDCAWWAEPVLIAPPLVDVR